MLNQQFEEEIKPKLKKELGIKNPLAVPRVEKVIINMRINEAKENKGAIEKPIQELAQITGQMPQTRPAKQSISGFKLTQGDPIGLKVSLRGNKMYDFLEKLFRLVLPRVKDFHGLSVGQFDEHGNYNLTLKDQSIFPEIDVDKVEKTRSLQITIVTSSQSVKQSKELLLSLGLPFEKENG